MRELPVTSEKPERPRIREYAALLRVRGEERTVLARRAGDGLFAGMWEPPRVVAKARHEARSRLSALLGVEVVLEDRAKRRVQHVLTHRLLDVTVHEGVIDRAPRGAASDYDAVELVRTPPSSVAISPNTWPGPAWPNDSSLPSLDSTDRRMRPSITRKMSRPGSPREKII